MKLVRLAKPVEVEYQYGTIGFTYDFLLAAPVPMVGELFLFSSRYEERTTKNVDWEMFDCFRQFHGREGTKVSQVEIPAKWRPLGECYSITYQSRKFNGGGDGRPNRFRHQFGENVKIFRGTGDWLKITGPDLYVDDAGIVN